MVVQLALRIICWQKGDETLMTITGGAIGKEDQQFRFGLVAVSGPKIAVFMNKAWKCAEKCCGA
jgi:hypothetical protein